MQPDTDKPINEGLNTTKLEEQLMKGPTISTDLQLAKVKPIPGERLECSIKNHPGLEARVASRSTTFRAKITCKITGKRPMVTLGDARKGMTISEAAQKLQQIKADGMNTKPSAKLTINDVLSDFYESQVHSLKRPKAVTDIFDRFITPFLKNTPLSEVETYQLSREIERIRTQNGNEPARKTLCYIGKFFRWCKATGRTQQNPAGDLSADLFKFDKSERDRHLSRDEVPQLFEAIARSSMSEASKLGLHILLRTGVRSAELLNAHWNDVNLETGLWRIPAENTKTNSALTIPLSPQVIKLFNELAAITRKENLVMGGQSRLAMNRALTRMQQPNKAGHCLLPFEHKITVHDLRRSFVTFLNSMGVAPHIVEKMVNHKMQGVMAIYNRSELLPERLDAMCLLSNALDNPKERVPEATTVQ